MIASLFAYLRKLDTLFWGMIAFQLILLLGGILTLKSKFFQFRALPRFAASFFQSFKTKAGPQGTHPIKVFFASVGGAVGIGNVVGIATAVQIGGPGSLFWVWVAALIGSIIKYAEVYLGLKYRQANSQGGFDGGPMFFLRKAFKSGFIPLFVSVLLCIYGVEIYQFTVVTEAISSLWHIDKLLVALALLALLIFSASRGIQRVSKIACLLMPAFILVYFALSGFVIAQHFAELPHYLAIVFKSAFRGQTAIGGFVGASSAIAIQQGISRAAYAADIGIGYDSIIQSESNQVHPEKQARLAVFGIFLNVFICSLSIIMVLLTGVWHAEPPIEGFELVKTALGMHFPAMHIFMPIFLFLLGYTTLVSYFFVGMKCARHLSKRFGEKIYIGYALIVLPLFSFCEQKDALLVMSISGALLLIFNLLGIFRLRHEISFSTEKFQEEKPAFIPESLQV